MLYFGSPQLNLVMKIDNFLEKGKIINLLNFNFCSLTNQINNEINLMQKILNDRESNK